MVFLMIMIMIKAGKMERYPLLEASFYSRVWCGSRTLCEMKANLAGNFKLLGSQS